MIGIHEVEFDVSGAVPGADSCVIECTLFVPAEIPDRPVVVVALPGGSYNRRYWDMHPPGRDGFSQARYFAEHGVVFCAADWLGGGERSRPADGDVISMPVAAAAAHEVLEQLRKGLQQGLLGAPPLRDPVFVGLGQSLGGSTTIVQQGTYGDYAAIATLGSSDSAKKFAQAAPGILDGWDDLDAGERLAVVKAFLESVFGGEVPMYHPMERVKLAAAFYAPGMDPALIDYDEACLHTLTPRRLSFDTGTPGFHSPFAASVTSPVFLAFGELEAEAREPYAQLQRYEKSTDLTLCFFPQMAHMHNFADTRAQLWDRLLLWLDTVAALSAPAP